MPDLLVHLAFAYILARALKVEPKLVMLGALIPDVARMSFWLSDVMAVDAVATFTFLEPFHTPFMAILVAAAISFALKNRSHAFALMIFGGLTHFLPDLADAAYGGGTMLLYPLSFRQYATTMLWADSPLGYAVSLAAFAIMAYAVAKERGKIEFDIRGILLAVIIGAFVVSIPLLTRAAVEENNVGYLDFSMHPEKYEGMQVNFHRSKIVGERPLMIEEFGFPFELKTDAALKQGDWASVVGKYENGVVTAEKLHVHSFIAKPLFSLIGLAMFGLIWFSYLWRK